MILDVWLKFLIKRKFNQTKCLKPIFRDFPNVVIQIQLKYYEICIHY